MAITSHSPALMTSNQTGHQAKSIGDGSWAVSYLPGRTLTTDQAAAAIQAAEIVAVISDLARRLGLTALETITMAIQSPPWPVETRRHRELRLSRERHGAAAITAARLWLAR